MIYFVRMRNLRLIKIGFTGRPEIGSRLKELRNRFDDAIEVVSLAEGQRKHEAKLHSWFSPILVTAEFFRPDDLLLEYADTAGSRFPVGNGKAFVGDDLRHHQWTETACLHVRCAACGEIRHAYQGGFCSLERPCPGSGITDELGAGRIALELEQEAAE